MRWICAVIAFALVVATPSAARSSDVPSPADLQDARERFAEGRKLEEAGQFGEALVAFQRVGRVKMTPPVRFHIALCLMHTAKPSEALATFRTAVNEAGATAPQVVVEAKEHIAALEKQVAIVTIDVRRNDPTLSVTFDEGVVTPGMQLEADPGAHRILLQRAGQTVDERRVTLRAGERSRFELSALPVASSPPNESTTPTASSGPRDLKDATNLPRVGSIVAFSVAGASVVGLSAFAFLRSQRLAELEAACPSFTGCDRSVEPVVRDGKTYAAGVNVFAAIGGAAAVTGVVLYVVSQRSAPRHGSKVVNVGVQPMVGLDGGFVTVRGRF